MHALLGAAAFGGSDRERSTTLAVRFDSLLQFDAAFSRDDLGWD